MKLNKEGLELIEHFEGFYPKPYICPAGVPTIGIGTIAYENGKKVSLKDPAISKERAYELLNHELGDKCEILRSFAIRKGLVWNDNQFSAIVSLCYNLGTGIVTDSGRSIHQALLSKNPEKIKAAFMLYTKAKKRFIMRTLPGLVRRRKAEIELFFKS